MPYGERNGKPTPGRRRPILVSACLTGRCTRYDGRTSVDPDLLELLADEDWIAVCPEQLGGLPTPRPAASLVGGDGHAVWAGRARVLDRTGRDLTAPFMAGARAVLSLARRLKVGRIFLKDRSPSCGLSVGPDSADRRPGPGVLAALLTDHGFEVIEVRARAGERPALTPVSKP